jgi:hypothetical protein
MSDWAVPHTSGTFPVASGRPLLRIAIIGGSQHRACCNNAARGAARGVPPLALSPGYLPKEIFSLPLGERALSCLHGTAGDGDDRQGYRGSAGNCRAVVVSGGCNGALSAPCRAGGVVQHTACPPQNRAAARTTAHGLHSSLSRSARFIRAQLATPRFQFAEINSNGIGYLAAARSAPQFQRN